MQSYLFCMIPTYLLMLLRQCIHLYLQVRSSTTPKHLPPNNTTPNRHKRAATEDRYQLTDRQIKKAIHYTPILPFATNCPTAFMVIHVSIESSVLSLMFGASHPYASSS